VIKRRRQIQMPVYILKPVQNLLKWIAVAGHRRTSLRIMGRIKLRSKLANGLKGFQQSREIKSYS